VRGAAVLTATLTLAACAHPAPRSGAPVGAERAPVLLPDRAALEKVLVDAFQCVDGPEFDCFIYVEKVTLTSAACAPIGPDSKGMARVACRVSGVIGYTSRRRPERFSGYCIRVRRYQTPAYWGFSYEEGDLERTCEARSRATNVPR
jgi:hypothetical protein